MKKIIFFLSVIILTQSAHGMAKFNVIGKDTIDIFNEEERQEFDDLTAYEEDQKKREILVIIDRKEPNLIHIVGLKNFDSKDIYKPKETYQLTYNNQKAETSFEGKQLLSGKISSNLPTEPVKSLLQETLTKFLAWQADENKKK